MAPEVRLLALDLDGTLLDPAGRVSEDDAAAVKEAAARGVQVVFATARWHQAARRIAVSLGLQGYIISHNGALVRPVEGGADLLHHRIDEPLARAIAEHIDSVEGDAYLTVEDLTYLRSSRIHDPSRMPADMAHSNSLADSLSGPATAFLLFGRAAVHSTIERFRSEKSLNLAEGFSESFPDYLTIVHAGADKGRALLAVCEALALDPAAAVAIGDADPDIPMLDVAGTSVAMGNAAPSVKAGAGVIAPSNAESGVAWAIRKFVLS